MTLQDVIEAVQQIVYTVTGIRAAPFYAPETLTTFPVSVAFPGNSTWECAPVGTGKSLQTIVVEIHLARVDLPRDIQAAMAFSDAVPLALLADPTLDATVQTFRQISGEFGPMGWNGVATIGFRFRIEGIKMLTSL